MSTETLIDTLDWLARQEAPQAEFTGGEPFVRRDIRDLIRYGARRQISLDLSTNGCNIQDKDVSLLAGMRRIAFTFYGLEDFHDAITGVQGSYQKTVRTISMLRNAKTRVRANVVTMADALHDLPDLAYELQQAGVDEIKFSMMLPCGRASRLTSQLLTDHENKQLEQSLWAREDLHVPIKFQRFARSPFRCQIPARNNLCLAPDGRIYPCVSFLQSDYEIGRITDRRAVNDALEGVDWDKALGLVEQAGRNRCAATTLGLYSDSQDMIVHQGCPPFAERRSAF